MASKKKSRSRYEEEHNRRVRKVESDVKLRLDKYKHKLYDESSYESDDFYDLVENNIKKTRELINSNQ